MSRNFAFYWQVLFANKSTHVTAFLSILVRFSYRLTGHLPNQCTEQLRTAPSFLQFRRTLAPHIANFYFYSPLQDLTLVNLWSKGSHNSRRLLAVFALMKRLQEPIRQAEIQGCLSHRLLTFNLSSLQKICQQGTRIVCQCHSAIWTCTASLMSTNP